MRCHSREELTRANDLCVLPELWKVPAMTNAYSARMAGGTYQWAGFVMASRTTVRWSPSGLSAAETTTFVSRTNRNGIIDVWNGELPQ